MNRSRRLPVAGLGLEGGEGLETSHAANKLITLRRGPVTWWLFLCDMEAQKKGFFPRKVCISLQRRYLGYLVLLSLLSCYAMQVGKHRLFSVCWKQPPLEWVHTYFLFFLRPSPHEHPPLFLPSPLLSIKQEPFLLLSPLLPFSQEGSSLLLPFYLEFLFLLS